MGSVSSLISGHGLHSRTPECKVKKGTHQRRASRSLDALLRCGFSQGSTHTPNTISQAGRSKDFFYINVSQKPRTTHQRKRVPEGNGGEEEREPDSRVPPRLQSMSEELEKSVEMALMRPTAFKPVVPGTSSSTVCANNLNHILSKTPPPSDRSKDLQKRDTFSGTFSDSGRNSMSSLPTHSTSGSLNTSTGLLIQCGGDTTLNTLHPHPPSPAMEDKGNGSNATATAEMGGDGAVPKDMEDIISPRQQSPLQEAGGCDRSPIFMDESLIEQLEQRLLERESELQELQGNFEEKESDTCQLFEDKQRHRMEEMDRLKQRCTTKLQQVSQHALRDQQLLQLQVAQLQQDRQRLQEELVQVVQEKGLIEIKLRSFEQEKTQLAPTLEETQWEVCQKTGEISLLKQQLRDHQADVNHKLNEIVNLKATLRETKNKIGELEQKIKEQEEVVHSQSMEIEVCQNELQRKANEADLLREKVGILETEIRDIKQDVSAAQEQQRKKRLEVQRLEELVENMASCQSDDAAHTASLQREVERLKEEIKAERETQERMANVFKRERLTWNMEKDRVIKYQKQLQLNYLQMHKKNQDLEKILQELTSDMKSRTQLDIHSSGLQYNDIIATEI